MKGRGLVIQHDVIRARYAHHESQARCRQQGHKVIHVILVGFGVIGVANIDTHRQTEQLSAKMIFEGSPDNLLAIV